jgi:mannosyltransferase
LPGGRFKVFAHLLAAGGQLVAQYDGEPAGGTHPTDEWTPGEIVEDRRGMLVPKDLSAGTYALVIGWYPVNGGDRLQAKSSNGESIGTEVRLGIIEVVDGRP